MRANLNDKSNPNVLTKKFWSYVKSTSNTSRIPTQVHRKEVYANDAKKQADLFNEYFYDQFSAPSAYNTEVDFANYNNFIDFHFDPDQISNILKDIDTNKSPGPDGITGTVLKKCSFSILSAIHPIQYFICLRPVAARLEGSQCSTSTQKRR